MLSAVLKSDVAVEVSIKIMNSFVEMRRFILSNKEMFARLDRVELKQMETDKKLEEVSGSRCCNCDSRKGQLINKRYNEIQCSISKAIG